MGAKVSCKGRDGTDTSRGWLAKTQEDEIRAQRTQERPLLIGPHQRAKTNILSIYFFLLPFNSFNIIYLMFIWRVI